VWCRFESGWDALFDVRGIHSGPSAARVHRLAVRLAVVIAALQAFASFASVGNRFDAACQHPDKGGPAANAFAVGEARFAITPLSSGQAPATADGSQLAVAIAGQPPVNKDRRTAERTGLPSVSTVLTRGRMSSALITSGEGDLLEGELPLGDLLMTVFGSKAPEGDPAITAVAASRRNAVYLRLFPTPAERVPLAYQLKTIERLYSYAYNQDPLSRFVLNGFGPASRTNAGTDQASALDTITRARECVLKQIPAGSSLRPVRWERARIKPLTGSRREHKQVAASVFDALGKPVAGAQVAFMRGKHLACAAKTDSDGRASCKLFDAHGHADHDDDDEGPTVVTFGGEVGRERILLPRTLTLSRRAGT